MSSLLSRFLRLFKPVGNPESGGVVLTVVVIIGVIVLVIAIFTSGGGSVQSYNLAGPATLNIGSTGTYTVTLTLDAPAGLNRAQQLSYAISGVVPPPPTYTFDLVEADNGWDDTLHDDVSFTIPWGGTTVSTTVPITCTSATIITGTFASDAETSHQLRVEGWKGLLPVESNQVNLTCVAPPPPPPPPPPCENSCAADKTTTIRLSLPCPPCEYNPDNQGMALGASLLAYPFALREAAKDCSGEHCRCAPHSREISVDNCRVDGEHCAVDMTVSVRGTCTERRN